MKLIDADALITEIDHMLKLKEHTSHCDEEFFNSGRWKALTAIKRLIKNVHMKKIVSKEEKARRYDEAIKKAKFLKENTDGVGAEDVSRCFEEIFPELKESEDEILRKELLQIAKDSEDSFYIVLTPRKRESLISFLEKQREQNSDLWTEDDDEHVDSLLERLDGLCRNEFVSTRFAVSEDRCWLKSLKTKIFN